jgi:hypothetical protein
MQKMDTHGFGGKMDIPTSNSHIWSYKNEIRHRRARWKYGRVKNMMG